MRHPPSPPSHLTHQAAEWHALQREGELSPAQRMRFMRWLVTSPEHTREYLAIGRIAGELADAMRAMPIDLEALIADADTQSAASNVVALSTPRGSPAVVGARPRPRALRRVAAGAVMLLGLGLVAQAYLTRTTHYVAVHGAPRSFTLPDDTVVHLNAESQLATRFGLFRRRVELARGQASFVVAPGRRPFEVSAAGLRIRDIGTTFDVSLRREQARIGVAEGRVQVVSDNDEGRLLADLRAGQSAGIDYRDHAVSIGREDVASMTAWWQRRVVFRDEPLRDVADRFNRLNAVRLQVDDAAAAALRLTGNLSADDLESLRLFLDEQPTLTTSVNANRITVRGRIAESAGAQER